MAIDTLHFRPLGGESLSDGSLQCERDFRPFSIRRRSTSMPPLELSLLIQPWVLLRLMFLGWYSVPLFLVRTCWYCQAGCWNTPAPSACEDISPHLEIGGAADLGTIQLLNSLRWEVPARLPPGMLLGERAPIKTVVLLCGNCATTNYHQLKWSFDWIQPRELFEADLNALIFQK